MRKERQQENVDIFDFSLSEEDMKQMASMDEGNRLGAHPDEFDYGV